MSKAVIVRKTIEIEVPDLGDQINAARKRSDQTITNLASTCDMSVQNWYRIEKGVQVLDVDVLRKIETALGVDFGVSFEG